MASTQIVYASTFGLFTSLRTFLLANGWSELYSRITVFTDPAFFAIEGGQTGDYLVPPVITVYWDPSTSFITLQAFKNRGDLAQGYGDYFGNVSESGAVIEPILNSILWHLIGVPGSAAVTSYLTLTPDLGMWDPANTHYTMVYQHAPGRTYAIRATGEFKTTAVVTAGSGIAIVNGLTYIRLFLNGAAGASHITLDTYDGAASTIIADVIPAGYAPGTRVSLYLEQLGGPVFAYYQLDDGPWILLGATVGVVDERVITTGTEYCGLFNYSNDITWTSKWYEFRWPTFKFGTGDPIFFAGSFSLDPTAAGQARVYSDLSKFIMSVDPGAGAHDIIFAGSFLDHTDARTYDSKVCLVMPKIPRAGLYVQTLSLARQRIGIGMEQATAELGNVFSSTGTAFMVDEQPQLRTTKYIMHPIFIGLQFLGKQQSGELPNFYLTDTTLAPPANYDVVRLDARNYLYFDGFVFGPVSLIGGEVVFNGARLTWVDPDAVEAVDSYLPSSFIVYEGAEQPQIVIEWNEPVKGWGNLTNFDIRRKLYEYPLDETDGDLIYTGTGTELGYSDRTVVADNFYYYKAFSYANLVWSSNETCQGNARSWASSWGEKKLYKSLPGIFRSFDNRQVVEMEQAVRTDVPEVINFQEDGTKGFLRRMLKNYGLEVDRIKAFHSAYKDALDPIRTKLDWLKALGHDWFYTPAEQLSGLQQKYGLIFWPYQLKKKGTELLLTAVIEQTLNTTPTYVYGRDLAAKTNEQLVHGTATRMHTWNKTHWDLCQMSTDVNCYTHGGRSVYNDKGILIYLSGTFLSSDLTILRQRLTKFTPAASVIAVFVNEEFVFLLKAENGDGCI